MSVKLSDFATGQTVRDTDHVVGYADTNTGGERKWTLANLRDSLITGAATTIDTENLAASRALISDASGKVGVSNVTSTEIGYLDGVTSGIQAQLNSKGPGTVTSVTGTAPISVATGTTTPEISIAAATTSSAGSMSSTDKTRLNGASGVNGIIKCNGSGSFSTAVAGTDYLTTNISVISSLGDRSFPTLASSFDYKYIPTWAKKVTILFHGVSLSTDTFMVQLGTGTNTIFDSSYRSTSLASGGAGGTTAGFLVDVTSNGRYLYGAMTLSLFSGGGSGGYTWISSHACGITDSSGGNHNACYGGGTSPNIGASLTWLRFKATSGIGLFDSGSVSVLCE